MLGCWILESLSYGVQLFGIDLAQHAARASRADPLACTSPSMSRQLIASWSPLSLKVCPKSSVSASTKQILNLMQLAHYTETHTYAMKQDLDSKIQNCSNERTQSLKVNSGAVVRASPSWTTSRKNELLRAPCKWLWNHCLEKLFWLPRHNCAKCGFISERGKCRIHQNPASGIIACCTNANDN